MIDGDAELRELEAAIASRGRRRRQHLAQLHARYDEIGGYQARSRAQTLLRGPRLRTRRTGAPGGEFSGGWRMRLNLARALMCRADLLLLDEPTNHLDLDAVMWLEDWLQRLPRRGGADHARPRVPRRRGAGEIVHIENRKLKPTPATTARFETQRAARLALQQATYREAAAHHRAPRVVHHALPRQGDQGDAGAKPHQGAGEDGAHRRRARRFAVRRSPSASRWRSRASSSALEDATLGYGGAPVLSGVEWSVLPGDAIGLLGPNGAGKSTLLKIDRRRASPLHGRQAAPRAGAARRLLRPAPGRPAAPRRIAAVAPGEARRRASASRSCATSSAASTSAATR